MQRLSKNASQVLKHRKNQLLQPRTISDKIKMAGGTTLALLGLYSQDFLDTPSAKAIGIITSCIGLYTGYHGLRRSSQRDLYLQAQLIKRSIENCYPESY